MVDAGTIERIRSRDSAPITLDAPLPVAELPTPALVLDRAVLEQNIAKMAQFLASQEKGFRPHAKTHKCPIISRMQLDAEAVGVCAAKVSEAVALVAGGVDRILITSPIVTAGKARVVNELTDQCTLQLVVDSHEGLAVLDQAIASDARLGVFVDTDVAMGRTGTRDADTLAKLAESIDADPRFEFAGVQHYAGHLMHIEGFDARRAKSLELWESLFEFVTAAGIQPDVVTGAGTGTYNIDVEVDGLSDLQVGSYIFMDEEYLAIGGREGPRFDDFDVSLTVACTAISQPTVRALTFDGGFKAFASETVMPVTEHVPDAKFRFAGDEHGVLILKEGQQELQLGDVVEFVSPHCDPTVNLHDVYWVKEPDGLIHSCWPITARGCSW